MSLSIPSRSDLPPVPPSVFVVGCDRSGTTLLTSLMESSLGLAAPLETHFIPYFAESLFLWGDLRESSNRRRLLTTILAFLELLVARNYPEKSSADLHPVTLLAVRDQAESLVTESDGFGGLIRGLFVRYAHCHGRRGWVDNSSFYESLPLEIWQRHLPEMKVVHIVRDGRDVALSWLKSWWGPATLGEAAWLWRCHVEDKRTWGVANPGAYLEIRYETLLKQPEETLQTIADFLGLPRPTGSPDLKGSATARILSTGGTHDLLSGPVRVDNQEKWRRAMHADDQRLFEFVAGETLRNSGYATVHPSFSLAERFTIWPRWIGSMCKRFVTPVYYAKKAKWLIPLVLHLAGPLRGRVVRWVGGKKE
ncbi:MAG: sulfotransferase [Magnetococcales bacterium]|nr:sulfotransferase [Magnetococcales bacterium]